MNRISIYQWDVIIVKKTGHYVEVALQEGNITMKNFKKLDNLNYLCFNNGQGSLEEEKNYVLKENNKRHKKICKYRVLKQ